MHMKTFLSNCKKDSLFKYMEQNREMSAYHQKLIPFIKQKQLNVAVIAP